MIEVWDCRRISGAPDATFKDAGNPTKPGAFAVCITDDGRRLARLHRVASCSASGPPPLVRLRVAIGMYPVMDCVTRTTCACNGAGSQSHSSPLGLRTSTQTGMSVSGLRARNKAFFNTGSSWRKCSDAHYCEERTFTTETASGLTTVLRILSCGSRRNQRASASQTWWPTQNGYLRRTNRFFFKADFPSSFIGKQLMAALQ